ncbi:hypothetical protein UlMin_013925 [Ulmus minor]
MQSHPCFRCGEQGHWLKDCPSKTPSKSNPSSSSTPSSSPDVSHLPAIFCPKGHGTIFPKVSGTQKNPGRVFYSCGYRVNGMRCGVYKWYDELIDNRVNRSLPQRCPLCECSAGTTQLMLEISGPNAGRCYFACPIKKGHGACNFQEWCDNEDTNTANHDLNEEDQLSSKRTKFESTMMDNLELPEISMPTSTGSLENVEEIHIEMEEQEEILDSSTLSDVAVLEQKPRDCTTENAVEVHHLTPKAIHRRQEEFWQQISAVDDRTATDPLHQVLGSLIVGWLGRLALSPSGGLIVPPANPFFCCVFPSFDPIFVPKDMIVQHENLNNQHCSPLNAEVDVCSQVLNEGSQSGILHQLSGITNIPGLKQGSDLMGPISKALMDAAMGIQNQLLIILESTDPLHHESMTQAANKTFAALEVLSVDHRSFSERVTKFIECASSLAKIEQNGNISPEDIKERYENEKTAFSKISSMYKQTVDGITACDERVQSLEKQADIMKEILLGIEKQIKDSKAENVELKSRVEKIMEEKLESEKKLMEAEAAMMACEEWEVERGAAKEALERAKLQLRE